MPKVIVLDLRKVAPQERESVVINSIQSLDDHQQINLLQDQHPSTLCDLLKTKYGDQLECSTQEEGAQLWRIDITRAESCCGFC